MSVLTIFVHKAVNCKVLMMKIGKLLVLMAGFLFIGQTNSGQSADLLDHEIKRLGASEVVHLGKAYRGKVILVVNTASNCAFTSQYEGLERLYQEMKEQGLVVLGFPSNDFRQELSNENAIKQFCRLNYGVKFPMFTKVSVRGDDAHPFFKGLAQAADAKPLWNFHKYLLGRDGQLVDSFSSFTGPGSSDLRDAIKKAL